MTTTQPRSAAARDLLGITKAARTIFYVSDFRRAYAFYTETLGLEPAYPADLDGGWAEFTVGDTALCIHGGRAGTAPTQHVCSFSFAVADFDAAFAALKEKGVEVSEPFKPCGSFRVADLADPDGNQLSIEG